MQSSFFLWLNNKWTKEDFIHPEIQLRMWFLENRSDILHKNVFSKWISKDEDISNYDFFNFFHHVDIWKPHVYYDITMTLSYDL